MTRILVCGGLVLDITFEVAEWPAPQSVQQAVYAVQNPGGKGINQAATARRLGADVYMTGCIGADTAGQLMLDALQREQINSELISRHPVAGTGMVNILVQNGIPAFIAFKAASMLLSVEDVERCASYIEPGSVVLINYEAPQHAISALIRIAKERQAFTIVNPAPMEIDPASIDYWPLIDVFVPNLLEARMTMAMPDAPASALIDPLLDKGMGAVCITVGDEGCVFAGCGLNDGAVYHHHQPLHQPVFPVNAIDTTGASDAFCGALAVAVAEQRSTAEALRFATAAAGLACTQRGGTPTMPHRAAVNALLAGNIAPWIS